LQPAFGVVVRRRRLAAGLSQEALAAAAGLTPVYLSRVEGGKSTPSITAARALGDGLGCAAWELVKEAEEAGG
jgi:transcriptional regulator with XRE-family HTH domain